jgi:hypothetical protein
MVGVIQHESTDERTAKEQKGLIDAFVKLKPKTTYLQLILYGKPVATREVSIHPPILKPISFVEPPSYRNDFIIEWGATDEDATMRLETIPGCPEPSAKRMPLSYSVLVQDDASLPWETIAIGLNRSTFTIRKERFQELSSLTIRVIANDGVNSASITSQPIPIVRKP